MQAVLRVEGANIIPFTANNLNIFVSAVVAQLPNVTAKDIVISQVRTALVVPCTAAGVPLLAYAWPLQSLQHCLRRMHKHSKQQQLQHQTYPHMDPLGAGRACSLPEWECQPVLWPSAGHPSSMAAARLGLGACSAQAGRQPGSGARVLRRCLCRQQPVLLGCHHCWRPQAHGFHRRAASRGSSCSAQLQACACGCSCCQPSCANRGSHEKTT